MWNVLPLQANSLIKILFLSNFGLGLNVRTLLKYLYRNNFDVGFRLMFLYEITKKIHGS